MMQIKKMLFLNIFLCLPIASIDQINVDTEKNISTKKNKTSLPFNLEISLDIIRLELEHYKDQLTKNWSNNVHAQVIIEEAEILVQTAPLKLQNELKAHIIDIFAKNNINIQFTDQNTIISQVKHTNATIQQISSHSDDYQNQDFIDDQDIKRKDTTISTLKTRKKHKKKNNNEAKQIVAPKKIHGARRTMKRLKKEAADQKKRDLELIKSRMDIKQNKLLEEKKENFLRQEALMRKNLLHRHEEESSKILSDFSKTLNKNIPEENI